MRAGSSIIRYLITLAVTICAYAGYAIFIAPQLEGTDQVTRAPTPHVVSHKTVAELKRKLVGLLPPDGWEWQPCKILEIQQGLILFKDYQPNRDGSVDLYPLTLVIGISSRDDNQALHQTNHGGAPFVLRAPEGANLKFERPLSLTGELGQLQHGQLKGEVQVFRPATSSQRDDSLALVTQNVQISPERLFTLYETSFRFGASRGRGKHLVIDLSSQLASGSPGTSDSRTKADSVFSGIDRIELAQIDNLYLHRQSETTDTASPTRDGDLLGDTDRSLNIRCQGPFVFDFLKLTASFTKRVSVAAADESGDQLDCEELRIDFVEVPKPAKTTETRKPEKSIYIEKIVALGTPAVLTAPSQNAQATAERIEYDLVGRQVFLRSDRHVLLMRNNQRIEAPDIRYTFSEDGRLGSASINGPGILNQLATAQRGGMTCRWRNHLALRPDGDKKVISLDGALVQLNGTTLTSEELHLWLWEIPASEQQSPDRASDKRKPRWTFAPAKLLAERQVEIHSAQLDGQCGEAAAFWPKPVISSVPGQTDTLGSKLRPTVRTDVVLRRKRHSVFDPSAHLLNNVTTRRVAYQQSAQQPSSPSNPLFRQPDDQGPPKKVRFVGNQVQLQMQPGEDYGAIKEITVDGDVVIQQLESAEQAAKSTLELRGQKLRAIKGPTDLYRLFVFGVTDQPASVEARELTLTGPTIQLDQSANRLWIEGPGEMLLQPTSENSSLPASSEPASEQTRAQSLSFAEGGPTHVQWQGGMIFDGQQIYFESNVHSESKQFNREDGSTTVTTTNSAALSLTLTDRLDFAASSQDLDQVKLDIDTLVMVGRLDPGEMAFGDPAPIDAPDETLIVSSKYDPSGRLIASQQIRARRSDFKVTDDLAKCSGPGSLTIRQLAAAGGQKSLPLDSQSGQSNSSPKHLIDYIKVDFTESLNGDLRRKKLTFLGNVHCHYDGINQWNAVPNERQLNRRDSRALILDCQRMELDQWTPSAATKPNVEMRALGNARAKGHQFEATAERISYEQLNNKVVIEAPSRGNAELWANQGHVIARKIDYRLSDGTFEVQASKQIDYSHQGPIRGSKK